MKSLRRQREGDWHRRNQRELAGVLGHAGEDASPGGAASWRSRLRHAAATQTREMHVWHTEIREPQAPALRNHVLRQAAHAQSEIDHGGQRQRKRKQ